MLALCRPDCCNSERKSEPDSPKAVLDLRLQYTCMTPLQHRWIKDIVQSSTAFIHTARDNVDRVVECFQGPLLLRAGTVVIKQGERVCDRDPCFYALESGAADVFVVKVNQAPPGQHVFTYDKPGQTFGNMALLYDCPRTATIVARTDIVLWHIDRASFTSSMDGFELEQLVDRHSETMAQAGFAQRSLSNEVAIFRINLMAGSDIVSNLQNYYALCKHSKDMFVTTSCHAAWNQSKKKNGCAKVIPAIRSSRGENVRVFFFDDNIEFEGGEYDTGITNLRDVETGSFVSFGDGVNGFRRERVATNTDVHYSSEYATVLVQANILDAMEDDDYFTNIVQRYLKPDEKAVVFMDVNSTIISVDSISNKDMSEVLLGTIFGFIRLEPNEPCNFVWEGREAVRLDKAIDLKQLAKKIAGADSEYYSSFFKWDRCMAILDAVAPLGKVNWANRRDRRFSKVHFREVYDHYLVSLEGSTDDAGITRSWFACYKHLLAGDHCIVLNSFGVDTRKIIVKTCKDERQVLQVAVNTELWTPKDVNAYEKMNAVSL
eukprot:gb/GFBE01025020.1/.p1 GENE.gb/GFBE01025020.1/~~gb/GFBE01025020.1/.p1  ORF type:complete len:546 (+),score=95.48 gb/GFBE01025020.1/:1-1638(+)